MKKNNDYNSNEVGVFIQIFLLIVLITFSIVSFQIRELWIVQKILVVILGLVMAYNNNKLYKRNGFTLIYIAASLIMILAVIKDMMGI